MIAENRELYMSHVELTTDIITSTNFVIFVLYVVAKVGVSDASPQNLNCTVNIIVTLRGCYDSNIILKLDLGTDLYCSLRTGTMFQLLDLTQTVTVINDLIGPLT